MNAALYTIDWKNIQQTIILPICGFTFTTNAGNARVYGSELEVNALVTPNWTLSVNGGNTHGYITSTLEPGIFGVGEDLLNVPLYTATASSDYDLPLKDEQSLFFNADFPYVGRSHAYYATQQVPVHYNPGYGILNLAFGFKQFDFGAEHHTLTVSLYAQNVLDNHRTIQYPLGVPQVQEAYTVQPLTVGITSFTPAIAALDYGIAGRVVVLTGAAGGIGAGLAYAFSQQGARVVLVGRGSGVAQRPRDKAAREKSLALTADLNDDAAVAALLAQAAGALAAR